MLDQISPAMRDRLLTNRDGRLTADQWKDMVTEPLAVLLVLLAPTVLLMPRLFVVSLRGLWIVLLVLLVVIVVPMIFRAWRYARAPLQYERLYAGDNTFMAFWLFWRPLTLYTAAGEPVRFKRRLAPHTRLQPNAAYLVYYLREPDHHVLLSIAPADHPQAENWQPTPAFRARQAQRTRR